MKAVFFDMDGTLLPMDTEAFTREYFSRLTRALAPRGYEPKALTDGIWKGTAAMIGNDGSRTNEEAFREVFASLFGAQALNDMPYFDAFYRGEFSGARCACGYAPEAGAFVDALAARVRLVLATNPVFPMIAQEARLNWAGVSPERFERITSYENSRFCKPNPAYFSALCEELELDPRDCLMVGNDTEEDGAAEKVGMRVFFLTPCLINRKNIDISRYPHGGYEELFAYAREARLLD